MAGSATGGCSLPSTAGSSQAEFTQFLKGFQATALPLAIPGPAEDSDRFLLTDELEKVADGYANTFLIPYLPNFSTESEDEILGNFNFPDFQDNNYYYYARPPCGSVVICVVFYLSNSFSSYFGLVTYTKQGAFIDQLFVAGREGGSGTSYTLTSIVQADLDIQLHFVQRSWGNGTERAVEKKRTYQIQPNGKIVMIR